MINSVFGLISSICLSFKVLLCCSAAKPHPRNDMLNRLRHRRGKVNKESSFTAVQLGSDPKDSAAGGRLKRCREVIFRLDLVISCCFHWQNVQTPTCHCRPMAVFLKCPLEASLHQKHSKLPHVPLGHLDLQRGPA